MRPERAGTSMLSLPELIQAINRLELPKLGVRSMESHISTPHNRQRNVRVASVATIRILLVAFSELRSILGSICKCHELKSFYESRRVLAQKVLPETFAAFEYCREVLRLRGSTDSPIASKLAQTAYAVGDQIEHLKNCVDIATEYHELRYETIAEITKFAEQPKFCAADASPLLFSIEVTLPLRLEMFAARAAEFPDGVQRLMGLARRATDLAIARIESVTAEPGTSPARPVPAIKAPSPRRPSIKVLRGVRVRETLSGQHERIPSLTESPTPQCTGLDGETNKENPVHKSALHDKHTRTSRLRPPSKVENRRVVQAPVSPLREVPQPRHMNSRIFRPSQIVRPQRSALSLRTPLQNHSLSNLSDCTLSGLNTSFDCTLEETPLAHKSTRPSPNGTSAQLVVPRRRPHWVRV